MAKVLEETKSRESAVQAHDALQEEIDNLTSSLFTEANRMVAVERFARARAEEKMKSLEESAGVMDGLFEELQVNLREKVEAWEEKDGEVGALRQQITHLINAGSNGEALVNGNGNHGDDETIPHDGVGGLLFSDGNHVTAASNALTMALASPLLPGASSPSLSHNRNTQPVSLLPPRLLTTVLPYQEFLSFINYLRQLRVSVLSKPIEPSGFPQAYATASSSRTTSSHSTSNSLPNNHVTSPPPPPSPAQLLSSHLPLSSHLSQPFLKRCIMEDSDPTLRLDLAPSLGFLSRRNVQTAILDGTLLIEPSSYNAPLPGSSCAMCGVGLERYWRGEGELRLSSQVGNEGGTSGSTAKNVGGTVMKVLGGKGGWGLSSFTGGSSRTSSISTIASVGSSAAGGSSGPSSPITVTFGSTTAPPLGLGMNFPPSTPTPGTQTPQDPTNPFSFFNPTAQQIHIFRATDTSHSRYAICPTYCLPRLRGVCEFWNYVRVMERGLLLEEGFRFVAGRGRGKSELEREERKREKEVKADEEELELGVEQVGLHEENVESKAEEVEGGPVEEAPAGEPDVEAKQEEPEVATVEKDSTIQEEEEVPAPVGAIESTSTPLAPAVEILSPALDLTPIPTVPSSPLRLNTSKAGAPLIPRRSGARPTTPNLPQSVESFSSVTSSPQTANAVTPNPASPQRPKLPPRHIGRMKTPGGSGGHAFGSNGMTPGAGSNIVADAVGWEDRCWTEVVRLKESLFWTRVAGVGEGGEQVSGRGARVEAP